MIIGVLTIIVYIVLMIYCHYLWTKNSGIIDFEDDSDDFNLTQNQQDSLVIIMSLFWFVFIPMYLYLVCKNK